MNRQREDEDEAPTPPSAPFPPLQMQPPPAQVQAPLHPRQPAAVSNLAMGQVLGLLSEAKDAFFVCEELGLQAKRALACTCSTLRAVIFQLLRQPKLVVQESDAIWDNARFVANVLVANVPEQVLCVAGETCVPEMKLAHLRTLPKLKVGAMGPTAALFFGAAIADSDCVLRLSTGATKSLRALRERARVNLPQSDVSQSSDQNAMLGALTLNAEQHVTVLAGRRPWWNGVVVCSVRDTPRCLRRPYLHVGDAGISYSTLAERTSLQLGSAGICDAGMISFAPTLPQLLALVTLDLAGNSFCEKGLIALAPALRQLPALETLNLANNPFGDEGLIALVAPPPPPPPSAGAPSPPTGALTKLNLTY